MTKNHERGREPMPGWLFVLPWSLHHVGGVNEVVKNLIRCFCKGDRFIPHLLITGETLECARRAAESEVTNARYLGIWSPVSNEHPIASLRSFIMRLPYRCWRMLNVIKENKIEVINPHFPDLGSLLFILMKQLRLFRGRIILSFHLSDIRGAQATKSLEKKLWKLLLRKADNIVVVSDDLATEVLAIEPDAAKKLVRIYNGVEVSLFAAPNDGPDISNGGTKTIVSIGAFIHRKGHDILVRAFAHVLGKIPEARLMIIGGDGPEAEPLRQLIHSLAVADKVTIYKDVPHERIPEFLSRAALFTLASRSESFGIVVGEAGAAKLPVVCTRATGLRELITDQVTGRLVDIDDHVALADAIVDLLTHREKARDMAARLNEQVRTNFTWHKAYGKYLQIVS
jgi:glycosyltransferase involved in cell wall biosynthesis